MTAQPYSLRIEVHGGEIYGEESGAGSTTIVRDDARHQGRAVDVSPAGRRAQFSAGFATDITMFNWPGNDYRDEPIVDDPAPQARALQDAKRVSLGFLHWLQTEAPGRR